MFIPMCDSGIYSNDKNSITYYYLRDYTRPDLPSGSDNELGGASGGAGVPDLSAALAGKAY